MSLVTNLIIILLGWVLIRGADSSAPYYFHFTPRLWDGAVILMLVVLLHLRDSFPKWLEGVQRWCYRNPMKVLVPVGVITIPLAFGIFRLHVQPVFDGDLPDTNPKVMSYNKYEKLKDEHSFLLTVYNPAPEGMLTLKGLDVLGELSDAVEDLPGVNAETILSIRNIRSVITVDKDTVDVRKLIDRLNKIDDPGKREAELRQVIRNHPLAYGRLISRSEKYAVIQVRHDPSVDRPGLYRQTMRLLDEFSGRYPDLTFGVAGFDLLEQRIMAEVIFMAVVLSTVATVVMIFFLALSFGVFRKRSFNHHALSGVIFSMVPLTFVPCIWVMGSLGWAGIAIDTVSAVIPIVFIAVASSYGVHTFHHISTTDSATEEERVLYGCAKVSRALFTSSVTTAIGFLTLAPFAIESIRKFGIFSGLGVLLMLVIAYICTPAWFAVWHAPYVRELKFKDSTDPVEHLLGIAKSALRHPVIAALCVVGITFAVGYQCRNLSIGSTPTKFLTEGDVIRETAEQLATEFGTNGALFIAVETHEEYGVYDTGVLKKLDDLATEIAGMPGVAFVQNIAEEERYLNERYAEKQGLPDTREGAAQLMFAYEMVGEPSQFANFDKSVAFLIAWGDYSDSATVDMLYNRIGHLGENYGLDVTVGGEYVLWSAQTDYIVHGKLLSWMQSLLLIFLLAWLVFRTWYAGVVVVVPLTAAIILILGGMAVAGISLDIASTVITSITIGVGADYAIHVYNAALQERDGTLRQRLFAVLDHSGKPIVFDGLSNILGFGVFTASALQPVAHCGWMLVLGMVIACMGALVIVPLLLKLKPPQNH